MTCQIALASARSGKCQRSNCYIYHPVIQCSVWWLKSVDEVKRLVSDFLVCIVSAKQPPLLRRSVFGVRYSYVTKSRVSSSFCATILQTVIAITFRDSDHVTAESRKVKQALPSRSNSAVGALITSPRWLEQERDSKGRIGGKREVKRNWRGEEKKRNGKEIT